MEQPKKSAFLVSLLLQMLVLCSGTPYGNRDHFIESPKLSSWGDWGKLEHCPSDQVVVGMKLKVHENQGLKDDSGLNAVKFYCQNPYSLSEYAEDVVGITSLVGNIGVWKQDFFCPAAAAGSSENKLIAVGFQLRSESSAGVKDDTAGNNLKLVCSDLYQKQGYTYLEGDGTQRGEWTERQLCWPGYAICALQTQVEAARSSLDSTGLNNLKVRCCRVDSGYNIQTAMKSNTTHHTTNQTRDSSSASSLDNTSSSSTSDEKDIIGNHNHHPRGDHSTSDEESAEGLGVNRSGDVHQDLPEEQELTAIVDPEPSAEFDSTIHEEPLLKNHSATEAHLPVPPTEPNEGEQHSASNEEDDTLPEKIAQIDQVDNSEAHNDDDDENESTATDSEQHGIPEEVVNALEDADSASADSSSSQNEHDQHSHHHDHSFHWGTEMTDSNKIADISDHEEGTNSLEEEPKSSPRFGQIGENATVLEVSSHASHSCNSWYTLVIVGPMTFLYMIKSL